MRVKICGITRMEDVNVALTEGADALGFVVGSPSSPRNLSLQRARRLMRGVHIFATRVAVTSTREARKAEEICETLKPDALQLNYYTPKLIHQLRRRHPSTRLILATGLRDGSSLEAARASVGYSDAVLADTPSYTETGGTGKVHDWRLTAKLRSAIYPHPLILAGGLTPGNVKAAIDAVKPFAVDVSTGVERKVGVKDHRKIMEFITNAKGLPS